jgi:hypothetical protein
MATRFVPSVIQFLKNCHYPPSQDHKMAYFVLGGAGTVVIIGHGPLLVWLWSGFTHDDILSMTWSMFPPSLSGAGGAMGEKGRGEKGDILLFRLLPWAIAPGGTQRR